MRQNIEFSNTRASKCQKYINVEWLTIKHEPSTKIVQESQNLHVVLPSTRNLGFKKD